MEINMPRILCIFADENFPLFGWYATISLVATISIGFSEKFIFTYALNVVEFIRLRMSMKIYNSERFFVCCIHSVHLSLNLFTWQSKLRSISSWTCCQIIGFKMFMCVPIRLRVYIRDIVFVHVICCVLLWSKLQKRTKLTPFAKTMWSCLHYNQDEQKCRLMLTNSFHLQELE